MLWYIPLEQIDMRYTTMQDRITKKAFNNANLEFRVVDGEVINSKLSSDQFLNPYSTSYFKATQMMKVAELFNNNEIKNNDSFYISDIWFPGIESIKYMAMFKDINVKMYGVLHAGSFTPTDTVNSISKWARSFEHSLIKMFDGIFLGSEQIRQDLINTFTLTYEDLRKLHVTGLAFDSKEFEKYDIRHKEDIIIFPHRLHPEKQRDLFEALKKHINAEFVVTHDLNLSKDEYYKLLAKSKIIYSASLQENFGYSVLEGCMLGVTPILPNNNYACYKYMYPKEVLYNDFTESVELIKKYLKETIDLKSIAQHYDTSLDRQVKIIKSD
jgi:hypothetical protein